MNGLYEASYFLGGAFLINSVPHLASGLRGRAFQTPFASPPGQGLSSSAVNVQWGFFNLFLARYFGRFHGGNTPSDGH